MSTYTTASVPYLTGGAAFAQEWTTAANQLQRSGAITAKVEVANDVLLEEVSGPCPRCGDRFACTDVASAPVVKGALPQDAEGWRPVLVVCRCTEPHAGQPANTLGCGVRYNVSVKVVAP